MKSIVLVECFTCRVGCVVAFGLTADIGQPWGPFHHDVCSAENNFLAGGEVHKIPALDNHITRNCCSRASTEAEAEAEEGSTSAVHGKNDLLLIRVLGGFSQENRGNLTNCFHHRPVGF
jgi:hypothetical protein